MGQTIREVMTPNPVIMSASASIQEAACRLRDEDIGDVLVQKEDGTLCGLVTDRDIVVRAISEGRFDATLDEVCSHDVVSLTPDDSVADAVRLMTDNAVRRVPIVDHGRAVGMVSLGDLAQERDPNSALADISAAAPNN